MQYTRRSESVKALLHYKEYIDGAGKMGPVAGTCKITTGGE
jgi:hypothetical protein